MSLKTQAVIASKRRLLPPRFVFWLLFFCPQAVRAWAIMADFEQLILLHSWVTKVADILAFKRPKAAERRRGQTLCSRGFHKWIVVTARRFDVKQGKLVTTRRCRRCGVQKTEAL